jgi:hypothetical protein
VSNLALIKRLGVMAKESSKGLCDCAEVLCGDMKASCGRCLWLKELELEVCGMGL